MDSTTYFNKNSEWRFSRKYLLFLNATYGIWGEYRFSDGKKEKYIIDGFHIFALFMAK
jgi:hypothetical protein